MFPIACWTWWWPLSRPKHVVQLTSFITDQLVVFWLPYTALLSTVGSPGILTYSKDYYYWSKGKSKVHPIIGHEGLEGSRGIVLLFLQLRRWRGVGGQRHSPADLLPENTRYPLYRRLGGPQGPSGQVQKTLTTPGLDPRTVQSVASQYTDWAIPTHPIRYIIVNFSLFTRRRQIGERRFGSTHSLSLLRMKWTASRLSRFIPVEWAAVMTRLRAGCSVFEFLQGQEIICTSLYRQAVWPAQPPMLEITWVMQPGCEGCLLMGEM